MNDSLIRELFDPFVKNARSALECVAEPEDLDSLLAESRAAFGRLIPEMPYLDRRDHLMWEPTLSVFQWLAVHLACREKGIDAHALGGAMLRAGIPGERSAEEPEMDDLGMKAVRDSTASQENAADNEFVFEIVPGEDENTDFGMNITRCAVCHAYAKHDAMALTPYMCATDDLMSDRQGQGLRRTGTIALGAHQCDFRYKAGGEPLKLAEQYPDKIRTGNDGAVK